MIRQLSILNFKSIVNQNIPLGRFTVIIGENGAGKSNILEALAMASAASNDSLEREMLIGRGVRVPSPDLMKSAFTSKLKNQPITISIVCDSDKNTQQTFSFSITHDGDLYSDWKVLRPEKGITNKLTQSIIQRKLDGLSKDEQAIEKKNFLEEARSFMKMMEEFLKKSDENKLTPIDKKTKRTLSVKSSIFPLILKSFFEKTHIERFTVYAPEYHTLRNFVAEGQTAPLGTRGEGLLKLLSTMQKKEPSRLQDVNDGLKLLGWYKEINSLSLINSTTENRILVKDRFIRRRGILLDQTSTNEGFLFCLFYLTLFASSSTPKSFAIENIENGLNPKLCEALAKKLKELGKKYDKQAIVSSHSPAILDALNLDGQDDILLAVDRNLDGHTRITKINKPRNIAEKTTRLSELFLKGLLGGLPKNFI